MLSFIIPTLQEEKVLALTLRNLKAYRKPYEIIISDGRSTDATIPIARQHTELVVIHDGRVRQTIANARNVGAVQASGDFYVFLDADVHIPDINTFFAKALALFERDSALVGLAARLRVLPDGETWADRLVFNFMSFLFFFYNNFLHIGAAPGEFQMVRASAFKACNGFNEQLVGAEDFEFFQRLSKIGKTRYVHDLHVYHTGRRAHAIGWPRLLWKWFKNWFGMVVFAKSSDSEWKPIR